MVEDDLEPFEIRLKIERRSKSGLKYIPVDIIGNYLIKVQNLLNHCGEYISEKPFRARGQTSKDVIKRCKLLMKDADISSFDQHLMLGDSQSVLIGNQLGVDSIQLCSELLNSVLSDDPDQISETISNSVAEIRYRNRILRDIDGMIPKRNEGINILFQSKGLHKLIQLKYENKSCLSNIIKKTKKENIRIIGILSEMRVTQGPKKIELTGPEGKIKIKYSKDRKSELLELMNLGQPIEISGVAKMKEDETIEVLENIKEIRKVKSIDRHRIVSDEYDLILKSPLRLNLRYEDDNWIMDNPKLGIYSQCKDYNDCLKEAESEFTFIVKEYLESDEGSLTEDAKVLRAFLKEMVKEN